MPSLIVGSHVLDREDRKRFPISSLLGRTEGRQNWRRRFLHKPSWYNSNFHSYIPVKIDFVMMNSDTSCNFEGKCEMWQHAFSGRVVPYWKNCQRRLWTLRRWRYSSRDWMHDGSPCPLKFPSNSPPISLPELDPPLWHVCNNLGHL